MTRGAVLAFVRPARRDRRMKTQQDVIRDVTARLEKLGVRYMLTGSVAMNLYAEPRMTRDIDLVLDIAAADVRPLVEEFAGDPARRGGDPPQGGDYYVDEGAVAEAVRHSSMFNMIHLDGMTKVDCIVRKSSEYRTAEFERRRYVDIAGLRAYVVSKEDLILSKLVWARGSHSEMQLRDVANLLRAGFDGAYLDRWKDVLGVGGLLGEVTAGLSGGPGEDDARG